MAFWACVARKAHAPIVLGLGVSVTRRGARIAARRARRQLRLAPRRPGRRGDPSSGDGARSRGGSRDALREARS